MFMGHSTPKASPQPPDEYEAFATHFDENAKHSASTACDNRRVLLITTFSSSTAQLLQLVLETTILRILGYGDHSAFKVLIPKLDQISCSEYY